MKEYVIISVVALIGCSVGYLLCLLGFYLDDKK
jgi:hypothetical protein